MLARLAQGAAPAASTPTPPNAAAFSHYQQLLANPMMAQSMLHQLAARQSQAGGGQSPDRHPQPPRSPSSSTNSIHNNQMVTVDSDEVTEE